MNTYRNLITLLFCSLLVTTGLTAQDISKVGTTAADFLRIPVGARSTAMSANVASVNDLSAMYWNPAALALLEGNNVMLEYTDWFIDVQHNYVAGSLKLKNGGVLGLNVIALTMDDFEETTIEAQGKTGRTFSAYSIAVGTTYAQKITSNLSVGGTLKFINETIFDSDATGIAFDVGTLYKTPFEGIMFGVSISNVGSKMKISGDDLIIRTDVDPTSNGNADTDALLETEDFDLPIELKVGLAWDAVKKEQFRLTLAADGNNPTSDLQSVSLGGEIGLLNEQLFVRGGVPKLGVEDRTEKFNVGIGINYALSPSLKLNFGYTYQSFKYLSSINKMTLQLQF